MNPEFDLLLTAYLDGELESEPRLRVESAVRGDPSAADRLAVLGRVRDLVAALPAPESCPDVSGEVVARLALRRRSSFRTAKYAAAIFSGLAAAAVLLMLRAPGLSAGRPASARSRPEAREISACPARRAAADARAATFADPRSTLRSPTRSWRPRSAIATTGPAWKGLLRQGGVRVVDLLVDEFGPASLGVLDDMVRTTSRIRPDHAKIHVVQGVEVDPSRPGRGVRLRPGHG